MKKYLHVFRLALSNQFVHRFNFVFGQLRQLVVLLLLYYVWSSLTRSSGQFAGYTTDQFMTYVFGVVILRAIVFGGQGRELASDINSGTFSTHLLKPIHVLGYYYTRELAERFVLTWIAFVEVALIVSVFHIDILHPTSVIHGVVVVLSFLFAHVLYVFLSILVSLLAFWTREAMGPRFFFEWVLEFASGAYFPLTIVGGSLYVLLRALPFFYLIFFPMSLYIHPLQAWYIPIAVQVLWIVIVGFGVSFVWRRGLRAYTGEGV